MLLVLAAVAGAGGTDVLGGGRGEPTPRAVDAVGQTTVQRVVDGDTVVLRALGRSRLIGIDTPEVHGRRECYGAQAFVVAKRLLAPGERVRYELGREPRDRYGRALVYVWLADGRLVNALLLARGAAVTLTIAPNDDRAAHFEDVARRARLRAAGLWSSRTCDGDGHAPLARTALDRGGGAT